jgi:pyruvate dehydrogenase E2 component (dihydrolipoamide acetyltransferase)
MSTDVLMEALSPTMEEGRLVEWKKQEGEPVAVGDVLAEVETDKAVMDLVARAAGTLLKRVIAPGTTVPVGTVVGVIGAKGEAVAPAPAATPSGPAAPAPAAAPSFPAVTTTSAPQRPAPAPARVPTPTPTPTLAPRPADLQTARVRASPLARKIAADRGLNLATVRGSGPEGRVVAKDLETVRGRAGGEAAPVLSAAVPGTPHLVPGTPYRDVPLTQIRKVIAKRLAQSLGPVPTFYLTAEVDMERVWEAREDLNQTPGQSDGPTAQRISINDILLKATALALRQHPDCNAWWQDDHVRYWNEVHLGVAVAVEDGLITPVIRQADAKSLREISLEAHDLAQRARERRLLPEEYAGSTFSVSNLGMFDIDQFTGVINPPEAGLLAVGSIQQKPVVAAGTVVPRRRMRLTMSCDHRVIDGATGARFLATLKRMLENPLAMVW